MLSKWPKKWQTSTSSDSRYKKYVCESDYNEQDNICVECAPRENVGLTAMRAERMVSQINEVLVNS